MPIEYVSDRAIDVTVCVEVDLAIDLAITLRLRIVGWGCQVGAWTRVEGSPTELDPNRPHATTDNFYLFDDEGRLLPTITILGRDVTVPDEVIIRNSIVLPGKDLTWGLNNQILL